MKYKGLPIMKADGTLTSYTSKDFYGTATALGGTFNIDNKVDWKLSTQFIKQYMKLKLMKQIVIHNKKALSFDKASK